MRSIILVFPFVCISMLLFAQQPTYNSIYSENPPAFSILGIEPTTIEQPSTPQMFATSLQNAVSGTNLAPGFALETAPRLWFPTNNYTTQNFLSDKNCLKYLPQNISLSLATSNADTIIYGNLKPGIAWSVGGKVLLISGSPTQSTITQLTNIQTQEQSIVMYDIFKASVEGPSPTTSATESQINAIAVAAANAEPAKTAGINSARDAIILHMHQNNQTTITVAGIDSVAANLKNALAHTTINIQREGPMLELAGAGMTAVQNDEWKNSVYGAKIGIWLNFSYRKIFSTGSNNNSIEAGIVARFIYNKRNSTIAVDSSDYFDLGAKLGGQINKFNISGEYVFRYLTTKPESVSAHYTWKLTLNLKYQITNNISAQLSFGKAFDGNSSTYDSSSKFLGISGLSFSLPQKTQQ